MWGIAGLEKTAPVCQTVRGKLVILKNLLLDFLGSTVEASPGKNWIKDLLFQLNHSVELSKSHSFKYEALIPCNNKGLFLTHDILSVAVFHILCHTQDLSQRNIAFLFGAGRWTLSFSWQGKEKWQNQLLGSDLLLLFIFYWPKQAKWLSLKSGKKEHLKSHGQPWCHWGGEILVWIRWPQGS